MRRILVALGLCVGPSIALAETYVLPVVTARIAPVTYSTTTGFRNDSNTDVECIGRYVREDGRVLTSKYVIAARTHRVEPDTLVEARAVGSMRLECSAPLAIASRIQSSRDDGLTFSAGHVFAAAPERTAVTTEASRTIRAAGDLLALEPGGERASFTIIVKDGAGTVVAEQAYDLRPHSQQHMGMGALIAEIKQARVEIKVRRGRVIVLEQSRTKALAALAPEVTLEQRVVAAKSRASVSAQSSVAERLLLCPFKAAPFRDPGTGLCFMRDRWYDPQTGTFLTPDRSGYTDSSNSYAFSRNDPVNLSDPTGEAVPAIAYFGHVALQTGIDVGIDWTFHEIGDWWTGADTAFNWHDSLQTNFAINVASAGVAGKLKHFEKLRNPILRKLATVGAEYGIDVAATGTTDVLLHNQGAAEAFGTAAVGGAIGRGSPMLLRGVGRGYGRFSSAYNRSILSSELGAIGHGVRNAPKSARPSVGRSGPAVRFDARKHWHDAQGRFTQFSWPPNRGFITGYPRRASLLAGAHIDRYGRESGTFVSPVGVTFAERALPPSAGPYARYEVLKSFEVDAGPAEPWFGQVGLGLQYELPDTVEALIRTGYLRRIP